MNFPNLHVVFPTPPFPPTNIHLRLFCSTIVRRLGSGILGTTANDDDILLIKVKYLKTITLDSYHHLSNFDTEINPISY